MARDKTFWGTPSDTNRHNLAAVRSVKNFAFLQKHDRSEEDFSAPQRFRYFVKSVLLVVAYFVTAWLGLKVGAVNKFATLIWPPTGIALMALVIGGVRLWPGVLLGALLVNLLLGAPVLVAVGMATGNTLEAIIGASLLHWVGFQKSLGRLRDVFSLVGLAGFLSTFISASIGVSSLYLGGLVSRGAIQSTWLAWWFGDLMGNLVVAPFLLVWSSHLRVERASLHRVIELIGFGVAVVLGSIFLLTNFFGTGSVLFPHAYLIFPLLILVAVRLDQRWTVTAILTVTAIALWSTAAGHGRFQADSLSLSLFQAQIFLGVVAISTMVLSATVMERRQREEEKKTAEENQRFLKEATQLLSESIDYKTTLKHVAQAAVPEFADWCLAHVLKDDGTFQAIELASGIPEKESLLRELTEHYYSDLESPTILSRVVKSRQSQFIENASDEVYRSISKDQRHFELLKRLGFHSLIGCPLMLRDRILGVIVAGTIRSDRHYGPNDVFVLEEIAQRAAIAIENSRLYLEAREAIYARDEFLSIASHELKTPLTSLSLLLQMFNRGIKKGITEQKDTALEKSEVVCVPLKTATLVSACEEQSKKLSALLDDLLDLTRIRLGKLQLSPENLDLCEVVKTVIEQFRVEATEMGVGISVQCDPSSVGTWDRIRVEQVVSNLISNALKYGERKPIAIAVEKNESRHTVRLIVRDRGSGILPEMREKIFERFERAGVSGQKISGLGLGLYICRQIVEAHGGHIDVESEWGKGSTFTVELPIDYAQSAEENSGMTRILSTKPESQKKFSA